DNVVHPMWSIFQSALDTMRRAFDTVVDAIGTAWDKIKGFAAKPINFVIRTVLRDGLFAAFNWVIDKLGLPKDWQIDRNASWLQGIPGYASGGRVRGSSTNPKADNIPAMLT
ncbi:hypothetical protein, partial [Salmonella enterica]|uniref:hypothetical protein n=1 Tax=Salmonella enterica TaxID=28901 RepID=UPI003297DDCC